MSQWRPPTPAEIAEFDQAVAQINDILDDIILAYQGALHLYRYEEAIVGLAHILNERSENKHALSQYMAVTIHRITELQNAVNSTHQTR